MLNAMCFLLPPTRSPPFLPTTPTHASIGLQDLDRMYTSFMNNQVPALWTRVSFASLKSLASWNKDLLFRCDAL